MSDYQLYIQECRARIPAFVHIQFGLKGAVGLNRHAWGRDILIAPFNFFMGVPNFFIKLFALVLSVFRFHGASALLASFHLGIKTQVHGELEDRLKREVFKLETDSNEQQVQLAGILERALNIYLHTRNVAGDITAGTMAAICGLLLFSQFTPGSVSAGSVVADWIGKEHAVSQFVFGETLGGIWYSFFLPDTPVWLIVLCFGLVMLIVSVASAFAGFIHDPVQKWTGLHQRRLHKLLESIELNLIDSNKSGYRPKDTFVGRIYDLMDWVKGVF